MIVNLIPENTESPGRSALLVRLHPILIMESPTYALFNAVEEGDVERVQQAMEAGANANPDDGRNAFQGTTGSLRTINYCFIKCDSLQQT